MSVRDRRSHLRFEGGSFVSGREIDRSHSGCSDSFRGDYRQHCKRWEYFLEIGTHGSDGMTSVTTERALARSSLNSRLLMCFCSVLDLSSKNTSLQGFSDIFNGAHAVMISFLCFDRMTQLGNIYTSFHFATLTTTRTAREELE